MFKLGSKARDIVTGFEGIITARTEYLTGCARYLITPPSKDGKVEESYNFDENSIEILGEGVSAKFDKSEVTKTQTTTTKNIGGPETYRSRPGY